jgi:redox-sensitive bicupin YhaK (pirin superfamily)
MAILHRDSLTRGGFAGLKETRLIVDNKVGGNNTTWNGLGQFIFLADARYLPYGETRMHPHHEVDVITVMLEGNLQHEGSLEHGQSLTGYQVQAQRAGAEGFEHNEINPDGTGNRILQLWALPETLGEPAGYKLYELKENELTRIYGGSKGQTETFDSHTLIDIGVLKQGKEIQQSGEFLAYISQGEGDLNGIRVQDGDLIRGENISLKVTSDSLHISLVHQAKASV